MSTTGKKNALEIIYIRLTFDGSFQRTNIYKKNVLDSERREFRNYIAEQLPIILKKTLSNNNYTDEDHYNTIKKFAKETSSKYSTILKDNQLRIGNAQKFINLYWKICWILKPRTKRPIHCPFDSIILSKLGRQAGNVSWTNLNDSRGYKKWVKVARKNVGEGNSIAEWELREYIKAVNYS